MPTVSLRMDDRQHAEIARRAKLAGLSLSAYVCQAALADDTAAMVREIHAAVVGGNGHGLGAEAADALAALVTMGVPAMQARRRVEAVVLATPKADAAQIIKTAMRKDNGT